MKTLRFGIEIETVGLSRMKLAEAIHSVVGGTISNDYRDVRITTPSGRTWKVVPDGSLSGYDNGEIVNIFCRTTGQTIDGNRYWYLLTNGTWAWGSARYINTWKTPRWC